MAEKSPLTDEKRVLIKNLWEDFKKKNENENFKIDKVEKLIEDWGKYKEKIINGTLTLDDYTNIVNNKTATMPGGYLCNFLGKTTSKYFGSSSPGTNNNYEVKRNSDNEAYYILANKINAPKKEAEKYFEENIKGLLYEIVSATDPKKKVEIIDKIIKGKKYGAKFVLIKIAVLDNIADFLHIYNYPEINKLYNEFIDNNSNSDERICEKSYLVCAEAKKLLGVNEKDIKEVILLSQFLRHYVQNYKNNTDINNQNIISENNIERNQMEKYLKLLEASKNLILTGAPGTGKTYLAKEIAKQMIGVESDEELKKSEQYAFVQFHPSFDYTDFVEGLRPTQPDENGNIGFELKDGIFKEFCKKAAEKLNKEQCRNDFITHVKNEIEKNKEFKLADSNGKEIASLVKCEDNEKNFKVEPKTKKDNPKSETDDSSKNEIYISDEVLEKYKQFKEKELLDLKNPLYELAFLKAFDKYGIENWPFVFIIDEINRGEISKIFGELFFSIDPSYRGKKGEVKTQYANLQDDGDIFKDGFYVPENVYIIGTMNDIDRSVESFDFAMRRRFTWEEITAEESAENMNLPQKIKNRMGNLNAQISLTDGLNSSYHIGGAYFLDSEGNAISDDKMEDVWNLRLKPLLKEYLRGMPDSENKLKQLEEAFGITKSNNQENSEE